MATYSSNTTMAITGNFDSNRTNNGTILDNTPTNRMCKGTLYLSVTNGSATVTLDNTIIIFISSGMTSHKYHTPSGVTPRTRDVIPDVVVGPQQEMVVNFTGSGPFYAGYSGVYLTNTP